MMSLRPGRKAFARAAKMTAATMMAENMGTSISVVTPPLAIHSRVAESVAM
jgi:hypothetical protein